MRKVLFFIGIIILTSCTTDNFDNVAAFKEIVTELSSEKYMGRSNFNNGEKMAADYIVQKFNEYCTSSFVETPFFQPFTHPINVTRGDMFFAIDGVEQVPHKDYVVKEFSSGADKTMKILYPKEDFYTPDKFEKYINSLHAEDKWVVVDYDKFHTLPKDGDIYKQYLSNLKVGGIIFKDNSKPIYFKARSFFTTPFPVMVVGDNFPADAKEATVKFQNEFIPDSKSNNIIAWVRGTSGSDSCYVFLAHYDHLGMMGRDNLCLGSNDNASGSAALLTLAQYYSQPKNRPQYDMMFLWVGAEECNLLGSWYYVNNPLYPLDKIRYVVNLDMIGDTPDLLYYEGNEAADIGLDLFMQIKDEMGYFPNVQRGELVDNSDHYAFASKGVPAMYFESKGEYYQYYHSPADNINNFTTDSYAMLFEMIKEFVKRY